VTGLAERLVWGAQLDHSLVQPQPLWMTLLTEGFTPVTGLFPVVAGVAIVGWALSARGGVSTDPLWWLTFGVQLVSSCLADASPWQADRPPQP
jgi:hypothetical protein